MGRRECIAHVQLNSASYVWLPEGARRNIYPEDLHRAHLLDRVAPFLDPLWAFITIDHDAGTMDIRRRSSV